MVPRGGEVNSDGALRGGAQAMAIFLWLLTFWLSASLNGRKKLMHMSNPKVSEMVWLIHIRTCRWDGTHK